MKIACLSGKGGAGKTFVAVNLAAAAEKCTYIDCDVEEPNGRIFWKPEALETHAVCTLLPEFDAEKCIGCRQCVKFCRFHGLVYIKDKPLVFPEICHSCGGCRLVCPTGAITEVENPIGVIEQGYHGDVKVVSGVLNPGEASGIPVIRQALKHAEGLTILDGPPGSACSVMETVMESDYCVLVAEPTAFGFHNVQMVYELAGLLNKPCGLIINKQTEPYPALETFCQEHQVQVLARISYDPALAACLSEGKIAVECFPEEKARFEDILSTIGDCV